MLPRVPVIWPKFAPELILVFGLPQFGWFGKLNASNRNWSLCGLSATLNNWKSFSTEKSQPMIPGLSSVLRPTLPWVPTGWKEKVETLKNRDGFCCPRGIAASTPLVFGRSKNAPVLDVSAPLVTVIGKPRLERQDGAELPASGQ
jgi:hypothetical protein